MLLEIAAKSLGLKPYDDIRVVMTFATSIRSEVQVLQLTRTNERVVAKQYLGEDGRRRFVAETSVLRALSTRADAPVPRLREASADDLVIVMREVVGMPVENLIRADNGAEARHQLLRYASAIGLLHAANTEVIAAMTRIRQAAGYRSEEFWPPFARDPSLTVERIAKLTGSQSIDLDAEVREVIAGTFAAESGSLIQWDTWPGNAIATDDVVILADVEHAFLGNPLVDVSSWHLAFPAAPLRHPFAAPLPTAVVAEMDDAYQQTSGRAVDAEALGVAAAGRMLFELAAPSAPRLFADLLTTPIATLYELRLRHAAAMLRRAAVLPSLAVAMEDLARRLVRPDRDTLQPYPAFA